MEEQTRRKSWSSPLLYALAGLTAYFHCLILNQAYFANDLLNQYSHFRAVVRDQIFSGHFPLWNPYFYGGQPFFADPNVMMCYPLNYLTLLFPIPYGLGVFYFLHFFLAACGMHFWLKGLRLSENACRLGALLFSLSGFFWWELIHPPILAAFAWLPWWLGALERLSHDWAPKKAFGAGLAFAMIFVSGNFQMTSYFLYLGLAYFLLRLFFPADRESVAGNSSGFQSIPWKKVPLVLLFGIWGGLILLTHMIPAYEFSKYTNRESANQTYDSFNAQFSMKPETSYTLLFPGLGLKQGQTPEQAIQYFDPTNIDNDYYGMFGYLGIWAPFLIFMAFRRKDKKFLLGVLGLAVLCLMAAWGKNFFLHRLLCNLLPGINLSRAPFRAIGGTVACFAALSAFGFQALEKALNAGEKIQTQLTAGLAGAGLLFLVGCLNPSFDWRELLALGLGALGLFLWGMTAAWKKLGRWFFVTALILPLYLSGWGDFAWGPASNYDLTANFPAFTDLEVNQTKGRYFFDGQSLPYPVRVGSQTYRWIFPQDAPMELGIRDSGGYNPIYLLEPYALRSLPLPLYLNLMAVNGLLLGKDAGEMKGFNRQMLGNVLYYGSEKPPAYLTAVTRFQSALDPKANLDLMKDPSFDPSQTVVLSSDLPEAVKSQLSGKPSTLKYDWAKDEMNSQAFHVTLDQNSLVTFSEVLFSGWKAWVDGSPVEIYKGNHAFRTLFIPAGNHSVEFRYEPSWAQPLLGLAIAWYLSLVIYAGWLWLRRKSPSASSHPA